MDSEVSRTRDLTRRPRFGLDSNCVIALLSEWHFHHRVTLSCYQHLLEGGWTPVVPIHVILESFSVLTRVPVPYRLPPEAASLAIEQTFATAIVGDLAAETAWTTLAALAQRGLGGGKIYDALIAASAAASGATVLLTWDVKHLVAIAPPSLEVREPSSRPRFG
jgi:toxin FitB